MCTRGVGPDDWAASACQDASIGSLDALIALDEVVSANAFCEAYEPGGRGGLQLSIQEDLRRFESSTHLRAKIFHGRGAGCSAARPEREEECYCERDEAAHSSGEDLLPCQSAVEQAAEWLHGVLTSVRPYCLG